MNVVIIRMWDSLRGFEGCNFMNQINDVIGQWVHYYKNGFDLGMLMVSALHIRMGFLFVCFLYLFGVYVICKRGVIYPNSNKHIPFIILQVGLIYFYISKHIRC